MSIVAAIKRLPKTEHCPLHQLTVDVKEVAADKVSFSCSGRLGQYIGSKALFRIFRRDITLAVLPEPSAVGLPCVIVAEKWTVCPDPGGAALSFFVVVHMCREVFFSWNKHSANVPTRPSSSLLHSMHSKQTTSARRRLT